VVRSAHVSNYAEARSTMIVTTLRLDPLGLPDKLLDFAGHTRIARMSIMWIMVMRV
jgi:hypothetical protein